MIALEPLGDRAFLASFSHEDAAGCWASSVRGRNIEGVTDVVLAYRSAAVYADPDRIDLDRLGEILRSIEIDASAVEDEPGRLVTIPVLYDGPDLTDVTDRLGLTPDDVIELHSGAEYRVFAIGFLPGFPYAGYLPQRLSGLPRRAEPRLRVPAGSVAITGRQTGIYPVESPGGWHLLGRTPLRIANPELGDFPIRSGDRIRFQPITRDEFEARRDERP